jgi:hypothetical protein
MKKTSVFAHLLLKKQAQLVLHSTLILPTGIPIIPSLSAARLNTLQTVVGRLGLSVRRKLRRAYMTIMGNMEERAVQLVQGLSRSILLRRRQICVVFVPVISVGQ